MELAVIKTPMSHNDRRMIITTLQLLTAVVQLLSHLCR